MKAHVLLLQIKQSIKFRVRGDGLNMGGKISKLAGEKILHREAESNQHSTVKVCWINGELMYSIKIM